LFFDFHFTLLGFTNANGEVAGSKINRKHIMGLQPWVGVIGDPEVDVAENSCGLDKYYPLVQPTVL
jgi:hypothetical protein